jgi:hypothetical protein
LSRAAHRVRTKAGLEIGRSYIAPAPRELGSEAERIQSALLYRPPPLIERLADALDQYTPPVFVSIFVGGLALVLIKRVLT